MNTTLFTKIQSCLEARISMCELKIGKIHTTDDLKKLTIAEAQEIQSFCRSEESLQTKIVQCDLYHIIGMGNLTPPQMMKLTYLVKDYLQYRSVIKTLAMNFEKISALPGLPVSAFYKTHGFGGISLSSIETDLTVGDDLPFAVSGEMIMVIPNRLSEFIELWSKKSKTNISEENFLKKIVYSAEYGGIRWTVDNLGNYVGIFKQDNVRDMFTGIQRDHS